MSKIQNSTVLITGGASGIGRIMGRIVLEKGAKCLVIWDINEKAIAQTAEEYGKLGKVAGYRCDVSDNDAIERTFAQTEAECGNIDILINCAGIVAGNKTFDKNTVSDITRTMSINSIAPMVIAHYALPGMLERNVGHICNIASAGGMLANPKMSIYAASKWAVIGWSDSVRIELAEAESNVHFTTVAPYYITTGMFDGVTSPIIPLLKPEPTAKKIVRAIEKNKDFLGIPFGFHFIRFFQGILPTCAFDFIFGKLFGVYTSMDHFTGRK